MGRLEVKNLTRTLPATQKAEVPVPLSRPRNITDVSLIRLKKAAPTQFRQ